MSIAIIPEICNPFHISHIMLSFRRLDMQNPKSKRDDCPSNQIVDVET